MLSFPTWRRARGAVPFAWGDQRVLCSVARELVEILPSQYIGEGLECRKPFYGNEDRAALEQFVISIRGDCVADAHVVEVVAASHQHDVFVAARPGLTRPQRGESDGDFRVAVVVVLERDRLVLQAYRNVGIHIPARRPPVAIFQLCQFEGVSCCPVEPAATLEGQHDLDVVEK